MTALPQGLYPPIEPFANGWLRVGDGYEIYYEQSGSRNGKPAVYLHGGPGAGSDARARRFYDPTAYRLVQFDQRGCGKSRPAASLDNNTTWHLVADIEKLREHLGIERWQVSGGSWGSTLALAYAQTHPQRVSELILRGIYLMTASENTWLFQEGASRIFPEAWAAFRDFVPEPERSDLISAYHKLLTSEDADTRQRAARAWATWEASACCLIPNAEYIAKSAADEHAIAIARLECHYILNGGFLEDEQQLLRNVPRIRHVPCVIVHGRYDIVCPVEVAWLLHRAWPEAELHIVPDAGHIAYEPGIAQELVRATDRLRAR
ncbi:MAG TPA: prolyl aminopeptidase [Gammaproteobacteria bacterium]|nr:prolyl aminopeptidase [Gammaproteobacteria bacterium]